MLQREKRDRRRKNRNHRLSHAKTAQEDKSKPTKSQNKQGAQLSRCHKLQTVLVKVVHVLDVLIGLACIVYGSLVLTQFEEPAMEMVILTLTYGSAMLFASIMGFIGFYSSRCQRTGLAASAYTAPFIFFFYLAVILLELNPSSSASYIDYLEEHMDVLYLNSARVAVLKHMLSGFLVLLASLTAVEICRFLLLRNLVHFNSTSRNNSSERLSSQSSKMKSIKSDTSPSKKYSRRKCENVVMEPLLHDEEMGEEEED